MFTYFERKVPLGLKNSVLQRRFNLVNAPKQELLFNYLQSLIFYFNKKNLIMNSHISEVLASLGQYVFFI